MPVPPTSPPTKTVAGRSIAPQKRRGTLYNALKSVPDAVQEIVKKTENEEEDEVRIFHALCR